MLGEHRPLTATNLAVHHHLNCALYIHNVYHRYAVDVTHTGEVFSGNNTSTRFKRGLDWEATLFSWLDKSGLLLTVPAQSLQPEVLLENILADERDHFYISGIVAQPPQDRLQQKFSSFGSESVEFGVCKPDLLEIRRGTRGISWRVIDAKSSKTVKTSHHVQIYFYTLCLEQILDHPAFISSGIAGVWLPPDEGFDKVPPSKNDIKDIQLSILSRSFESFLFKQLPALLSSPRDSIRWHFNPLCRECDYNAGCRDTVIREGGLGNIPNISISDATVLHDLLLSVDRSGTDIEDLDRLVSTSLSSIDKGRPNMTKKGKRILGIHSKRVSDANQSQVSPVIQSVRTGNVQVIYHRNFGWPSSEDIVVIISVIQDPTLPRVGLNFFAISIFSEGRKTLLSGNRDEFIPTLADVVRQFTSSLDSTQFYVWSLAEHTAIQNDLVRGALSDDTNAEDVRLCIGALSQGAVLLKTQFQPILLSGALLHFLAKPGRPKSDYQIYLARMGLPIQGTIMELRQRILQELEQLQHIAQSSSGEHAIGQIHPIVVLKREVEKNLAFPVPGYWDLEECVHHLSAKCDSDTTAIPSYEHILATFRLLGYSGPVVDLLSHRNDAIRSVLIASRELIRKSGHNLLVNSGRRLVSNFLDVCHHTYLRKLFFMQQFEVLSRLNDLWSNRVAGCPDTPILEYHDEITDSQGPLHSFSVANGNVDIARADREVSFFDYLLVEDKTDNEDVPIEAFFNDVAVCGLMIPFNQRTMKYWDSQPSTIRENVALANIANSCIVDGKLIVNTRTYGPSTHLTLIRGHFYRLSPRLIDFNTSKILTTLLELDIQWEIMGTSSSTSNVLHNGIPFLRLIVDPASFGSIPDAALSQALEDDIQHVFRTLDQLDVANSGNLILKPSQRKATQHLLAHKLTVIWGPPGTGKTHTIALSILRLIEVNWKLNHADRRQTIIFVTAMTHDAVSAYLHKLIRFVEWYRSMEHLQLEWLEGVRIERVVKGSIHPGPETGDASTYIYAGTLYQLYNFSRMYGLGVDCIVADEAGQVTLASLSLILRDLLPTGRIIIAGDLEQLSPIYNGKYPRLSGVPIFGSVLECVMMDRGIFSHQIESPTPSQNSNGQFIIQLTENFRLNPDLGEFVSTIYTLQFQHQKNQSNELATKFKEISQFARETTSHNVDQEARAFILGLSDVMSRKAQTTFRPPHICSVRPSEAVEDSNLVDHSHRAVSLSLIRLSTHSSTEQHIGYDEHVHAEAALAAALVIAIHHCLPDDDIFVATPHRIQREAVRSILSMKRHLQESNRDVSQDPGIEPQDSVSKITVDTIERLQGSEASFVICLFSLPELHSADFRFLIDRGRLNVAISRARSLCILITSVHVLCPPLSALQDEEAAKGYAFLKAYEDRAWACDVSVDIDAL